MGDLTKVEELILKEIRENRKAIGKVELDVNTMKVKFATITAVVSMIFGIIGSFLSKKMGS